MKIHHLEVKNFRGFEHRSFDFSDQFNVLIGDNGTGKTAILNALAVAVSPIVPSFSTSFSESDFFPSNPPNFLENSTLQVVSSNIDSNIIANLKSNINPDDIRQVRYQKGQTPTVESQYPVIVSCQGSSHDKPLSWTCSLESKNGKIHGSTTPEILKFSEQTQNDVRNGEDTCLPLIVQYSTNRLWQVPRGKINFLKPESRLTGYIDCLQTGLNLEQVSQWLKTMELASLQRKEQIQVLEAVKEAIKNCLQDIIENISFDILEDEFFITSKNGQVLPLRLLSDGVRNMLAMVADIAYRTAVLNPHLGIDVVKQTPGIVLIDEIDLHLHPKWQRRVVEDLRRTFPEIQFFATTHSPFIIQSLHPGELINLDPQVGEYYNKSIEDITEDVMGVDLPQQSERWKKMVQVAEEYYRVLQAANGANASEVEQLKKRLDELTMPYRDDPAYQAFLNVEREAAGL
jgi:predicted ATP-binding protein involved in virulence